MRKIALILLIITIIILGAVFLANRASQDMILRKGNTLYVRARGKAN